MDEMLRTLYARARSKGYPARVAYQIITAPDPLPELEWQDYDSRAKFDRDGFTFSVRVEPDDSTDLSWLGEFSDTYEPGAVKNPNHGYVRYVYEWFVPTYSYEDRVRDNRQAGYARGPAAEQARADITKDAALASDYQEYVVALIVKKNDVELARQYLGGVGFGDSADENRRYVAEVVAEMVDEAMDEARATLAGLCA